MRQILIFILGWTMSGCGISSGNSDEIANPWMTPTTIPGQKFFDFDEIDYYFNDYDENLLQNLWEIRSKSEIDSLREGIITGELPESMNDLTSIDKLELIGFEKSPLDKSIFSDINDIFSVKPTDDLAFTSCINVYRDILVFKKNGKTVGVSKICFGCLSHRIIGTDANTNFFGQNGDYEKLRTIVREIKTTANGGSGVNITLPNPV